MGRVEGSAGCSGALGLLIAAALVAPVGHQEASAQRGFLLGTPKASLTVRIGASVPRTGSGDGTESLWDFNRKQLTVEGGDFAGASVGGELAIRASEHMDVTLGVMYNRGDTRSEFRDWVDGDDLPIEQSTVFVTLPVVLGVKAYLRERGRSVGRFAWIPRTWNPYGGLALGWTRYKFQQWGDFVDFETLDIFADNFLSEGWGRTLHLLGGLDVQLNRRMVLNGEARYGFARAPLESDFVGFPDLDLGGAQVTVGLGFRF